MAKVGRRRKTEKIHVEPDPAVRAIAKAVVAHMQQRIRQGLDRDGRPAAPWSDLYRKQREAIGIGGGAPGSFTGGTAAAIVHKGTSGEGLNRVLAFGAMGRTSNNPPRPPPWVFSPKKTGAEQARALEGWRRAPKKKYRSQLRSRVLWMLANVHTGGRHNRGRVRRGGRRLGVFRVRKDGGAVPLFDTRAGRAVRRRFLGITPVARLQIITQLERAGIFKVR